MSKELLQQALDALLGYNPHALAHAKERGAAIVALREAFALHSLSQLQPACAKLEAEVLVLRALLTRYRNETPLGYQPHMIAQEVDAALIQGTKP